MSIKQKNIWVLLIFILAGLVIGGLLGEIASRVNSLWWLGYGKSFGFTTPFELDLSIIKITFGVIFKMNISSIIGLIIGFASGMFIYKKI